MSYQKQIADAIVTALQAVSGAPATVEYRKADVVHKFETLPVCIVTAGFRRPTGRAFEGTVFYDNGFQVAVYRDCRGDVSTATDLNPLFVQTAKQALDLPTLSGLSALVRDVDLVEDQAWEAQAFKDGVEVSRFGLLIRTNEPQNG